MCLAAGSDLLLLLALTALPGSKMQRSVCMLRHAQLVGAQVRAMSTRTCGLVGLPNVGKSTLFNALCSAQLSQAANYPFCTIDPSSALVEVPDERLTKLQELAGSETRVPTRIEFTDTAGLVKGASAGAGLGNQFLAVIRDVAVVLHVVRCFDDPDIVHVDGSVGAVACLVAPRTLPLPLTHRSPMLQTRSAT